MKQFLISEDLLIKTVQYIATKPIQEALDMFISLRQLPIHQETAPQPIKSIEEKNNN